MTAMMFYQQVVPLSDKIHGQLRLCPVRNYAYAATSNSVPILTGEFDECARQYPIIFSGYGESVVAAALLGLRESENLFVAGNGQWSARYIPAFVRRYPFALGAGEGGPMVVCIDPLAPVWSDQQGDLLFVAGVPSPELEKAITFLREFQSAALHTTKLVMRIEALGLLRDADSLAQLSNGHQFRLSGLRVIDEKRLEALDDSTVLELVRSGAMKMIHAHLISLRNLSTLIDQLSARMSAKKLNPAKKPVAATT